MTGDDVNNVCFIPSCCGPELSAPDGYRRVHGSAGLYLSCINELRSGERRCGFGLCADLLWHLSRSLLCVSDCDNETRLNCHLFTRRPLTNTARQRTDGDTYALMFSIPNESKNMKSLVSDRQIINRALVNSCHEENPLGYGLLTDRLWKGWTDKLMSTR